MTIFSWIDGRHVCVLSYYGNGTSSLAGTQEWFMSYLFESFIYTRDANMVTLDDGGKPCDEDWEDKPDGCAGRMFLQDVVVGDETVGNVWVCERCDREQEPDRWEDDE